MNETTNAFFNYIIRTAEVSIVRLYKSQINMGFARVRAFALFVEDVILPSRQEGTVIG